MSDRPPTTATATLVILVVIAMAAVSLPARRAMQVEPREALRHDVV